MSLPRRLRLAVLVPLLHAAPAVSAAPGVVADPATQGSPAPFHAPGRSVALEDGRLRYQWPGQYFQVRFRGQEVLFDLGPGEVILHVEADGQVLASLSRPAPGRYRVTGLEPGTHEVTLKLATESQAGANVFAGFRLPAGAIALPPQPRPRQVEFIGDSHTVGYGSRSSQRECSQEQVWESTDTTLAYGPLLAARLGADYQVNAISGRGIVRNYNGFAAAPLPEAYRWALLDPGTPVAVAEAWQPRLVVVALGTNDFSTALNPGEPWADRQALRDAWVERYVQFVGELRQRYPQAQLVLWSTDLFEGEIGDQLARVEARLRQAGEQRLSRLVIAGLAMDACHAHPSRADHERIADLLEAHVRGLGLGWDAPAGKP